MAAKPTPQTVIDDIKTDWRLGQMSQQAIADKYGVSKGVVNKTCKGVEQDVGPIVTAGIQYQQALHAHDDRIVTAVESHVDLVVSRLEYLNRQAMRNVQESMDAECADQSDFRARADTILKSKETLVGKSPDMAVQINNTNGSQITKVEWEIIEHTPPSDSTSICPAPQPRTI
jgi:endo-beta-N-acetylglucosaminidase D